jgi:hypothetical protein
MKVNNLIDTSNGYFLDITNGHVYTYDSDPDFLNDLTSGEIYHILREAGLIMNLKYGKVELFNDDNNLLSSYWTPQSLVVEDAQSTHVVMTGLKADTNAVASDFTVTGITATVNSISRDVTNKIITAVLNVTVAYGDVFNIVYKGKSYTVTNNVKALFILLKIDQIVDGKYIDSSGNGLDATVTTITATNDALQLANNEVLKGYCRSAGVYDLFYDSSDTPVSILKSRIGHIYNNSIFNNDTYLEIHAQPLTGAALTTKTTSFWGAIDSDAATIITAIGVTTELDKRIVDTHVKDLKAINTIQSNFFVYNDLTNSVIKALYPIMGSTIDQIKYNWIKATNEDTAYRLTLLTGTTPRIIPNAVLFDLTFDLTTHFNCSTNLASTNSFSYYSIFDKISTSAWGGEIGCAGQSGGYKGILMRINKYNAFQCGDHYQNPEKTITYTETNSANFYINNKISNTDYKVWRNGVQIGTTQNPGASVYYNGDVSLGVYLWGGIDAGVNYRSALPFCYSHIGGAIPEAALPLFNDSVIRFVSSKNYCYFQPNETSPI